MSPREPVVVLTDPLLPEIVKRELAPHCRLIMPRNRRQLLAALGSAEGLITVFSDSVNKELLARAPRLKVVGNCAVGVDNIDLAACRKSGVRVVNTPRVLSRAVAELTLGLLLAAARRFPEGDALCRSGRFRGWRPDMLLGLELKGRHAVIAGRGGI